jgi:hypothetical protein
MKLLCILLFTIPGSPAFINWHNHAVINKNRETVHDTVPGSTLIVNAFDAGAVKARKNKKELFYKLADTLKYMIKAEMQRNSQRMVDIAGQPYFNMSLADSGIYTLIRQNQSAYAVVIKECNVYFEQKNVEVTKDADGTHRNAAYDIYAVINYAYYDSVHLVKESSVSVFHYFSTRSVASGLFAAGPNIVSNKEAAFDITRENVAAYFRDHFPW